MVKSKSEIIKVQTLEEIRDMLLKETTKQGESAETRSGFVNGVLDMYNACRNRQDQLIELSERN